MLYRHSDCSNINNGNGVCGEGYGCYDDGQCRKVVFSVLDIIKLGN